MNYITLPIIFLLAAFLTNAQDESEKTTFKSSLFEVSISQGLQGNFFVDYDRDLELRNGFITPYFDDFGELTFYQKRFVGTYASFRGSVRLGNRNHLEMAFERTRNSGVYDGTTVTDSGTRILINEFELNQKNTFYTIRFKRALGKSNKIFLNIGISYMQFEMSTIDINPTADFILIEENNSNNSNNEELGASLGFQYYFFQSGNFQLGVESQIYSIISYGPDLETISIAPVLKYSF